MDADSRSSSWLLLLVQLPSSPSSARVALWRRLRAIGATGMVNSAWVLPYAAPHAEFFEQLLETVREQGGDGFVLTVSPSPDVNKVIMSRFRADRGREYDEFAEQSSAFRDEISKETRAGKFIFAELEEREHDLEKLTRWLAKIRARDFFPDERSAQAEGMLRGCRGALTGFYRKVYAAESPQDSAGTDEDEEGTAYESASSE